MSSAAVFISVLLFGFLGYFMRIKNAKIETFMLMMEHNLRVKHIYNL
jgi:hypothetical protein